MKTWIVFVLLSVIGKTVYYSLQKKYLEKKSPLFMSYVSSLYGVIFLAPLFLHHISTQKVSVSISVVLIIILLGIIEIVGMWMYLYSLSISEMSVVSPLKKTKPVIVGLLEPFLLTIPFNPFILVTALLTSTGSYILLLDKNKYITPFKRIVRDKGAMLAVLSAILYALLSIGSRFGNTSTSPFIYGLIVYSTLAIGFYVIVSIKNVSYSDVISPKYTLLGLFAAFRSITIWFAYSLASATKISILVQLTILTELSAGFIIFNEKNWKRKFIGAILILVGVVGTIII